MNYVGSVFVFSGEWAMSMNRVQFQPGLSLPEFYRHWGTEEQCAEALEQARWPKRFRCPHCQSAAHYVLRSRQRKTFQCATCRRQTSLIAGLLFQNTHLPLTVWFLAIYLVSEAKTGWSALALKRHLGVSYPTAGRRTHRRQGGARFRKQNTVRGSGIDGSPKPPGLRQVLPPFPVLP
jgi:transposase-like protein